MRTITPELKLLLACCRLATGPSLPSEEQLDKKQVELECLPVIRDLPVRWQDFVGLAAYHHVQEMVHEIFALPSMQGLMPKNIQQTLQQQVHQLREQRPSAEQFFSEYTRAFEKHVPTQQRSTYRGAYDASYLHTTAAEAGSVVQGPRLHSPFEESLTDCEQFIAICIYGATHQWHRFKWLCDMATVLKQPHTIDWSAWEELTADQQRRADVVEGAILANALLAAPIPATIFHLVDQAAILPLVGKAVHTLLAAPEGEISNNRSNQAKARNPFHHFVLRRSWLHHS